MAATAVSNVIPKHRRGSKRDSYCPPSTELSSALCVRVLRSTVIALPVFRWVIAEVVSF
jgi:hypothetical protein